MGTRSFFADSEIQSDSELSTLIAEILSLESERKDLIGSLTPGISRWVDEISGTATSSVRGKVDCKEPFGILEDIEDLGHRMLSMSHFLSSSNSHIPLYKADELVSTSSKLMKISKDFYKSTEQAMEKAMLEAAEAEEKRKEEERKEEKKKRDRMRKKEKKKKQQQQKEKDEEDKKKRGMMRMKEKEKKKKKKQQQQQEEEEDAQVTSEKITQKMERKEEEKTRRQQEVRKIMPAHEFLRLSSNVLARPCCYRNELAMMITEEDEQEYERVREAERQAEMEAREAKREAERERERRRERSKQRKAEREAKGKQMPQKKEPIVEEEQRIVEEEHADEQEAKSPMEQLKERMDNQLGLFAGRRRAWEYSSGSKAGQCGGFEDKTTLSPMQFTHCIPGIIPPRAAVIESTLQIYSFKITGLSDDLKWPLNVYGVVAARDTVDHNRNLLFSRSSIMCQVLTSENDCYLCLTGPSRAILAVDPVDFEVELRVHDGCDSRGDGLNDRELICVSNRYEVAPSSELPLAPSGELPCLTFHSPLCRAELSLERLPSTVQVTILSVRVVGGGYPFKSGGQVSCSSSSADGSAAIHEKVVLLDSFEGIPQEDDEVDLDGYLPLSRNVVSVEFGGGLDVVVKAYGGSGSTSSHVYFPFEYSNISQRTCLVCGSQVEITVAWSRLVRDKMDLLIDGYTTQA